MKVKKIVLIFRKKTKTGFSIEEQFTGLSDELSKQNLIIKYELRGACALFSDINKLRSLNADIYHVTGDVHYIAIFMPWKRVVLTIHDMGHFKNDLHGFRKLIYQLFWYTIPIKCAREITVISKKTYEDLLKVYSNNKKITIIPNSFGNDIVSTKFTFNSKCPNLLQVGTHELKNIPRIIEAIKGLKCKLTIIGKVDGKLLSDLNESGVDWINHFDLSRSELLQQYKLADIVIFVSLEEGFGVPVLEAQAVGRPLITSNLPPMSDNAGFGACLVNPEDVLQIRASVLRVTNDELYRNQLIEYGIKNVENFRAKEIARRYSIIYEKIK